MSGALIVVFATLNKDTSARATIITGCGSYFCTAAKFDEMIFPAHPIEILQSISAVNSAVFDVFLEFSKPIIAAVNGSAFGGGVTQITLCDSVISTSRAKYSLPFSSWRVSPEGCSTVHLARILRREHAK